MRTAVHRLLQAAGRHFSAAPATPPSNAGAAPEQTPQSAPLAQPSKDLSVNQIRRSQSATLAAPGLTQADIARACVIHKDSEVLRAATTLQTMLQRQLDDALLGLIAEGIARADGPLAEVAPAEVAKHLNAMAAEVEHDLARVKEETAVHDRARRQHNEILWPLREAVSARLTAVMFECDHLLGRIAAIGNVTGWVDQSKHEQLIGLGLTKDQIAAIDPELHELRKREAIDSMRARMGVLNIEIAQLKVFGADPNRDPGHLAGLGFDALIEAQRAVKPSGQGEVV
jgi:hypothetical protein